MQRFRDELTRAVTHERAAAVFVDAGIALTSVGVVVALFTDSLLVLGISAVGLTVLMLGMGLYLPAYFIGQELFDTGGIGAVVFVYLFGTTIALSLTALVLLAPADIARLIAVILLISAVGGRTELRRPANPV